MPPPLRLLALLALAGCASASGPSTAGPTEAEMGMARAAVERAREVGAETAAPTEFRAATSRLLQAQAALEAGDGGRAARLAREATVDGKLAEAAVLASRARRRAQIAADVDTLRAQR